MTVFPVIRFPFLGVCISNFFPISSPFSQGVLVSANVVIIVAAAVVSVIAIAVVVVVPAFVIVAVDAVVIMVIAVVGVVVVIAVDDVVVTSVVIQQPWIGLFFRPAACGHSRLPIMTLV